MPTSSDRRIMQLDPHILDFLMALEGQDGSALSTLSPADARDVLLSVQRSVNIAGVDALIEQALQG